ncbi:tagatose-bisphosphate aldolase [Aerococcus viridans]|uniref:tagatose-bisphosphate aldolase n=1 Tax=Aerococcus urinaeequi TaxID=51665 RepID=UPI003AAFFB27
MLKLTKGKYEALNRLSDDNGIISALAIDQRGSLKKMLSKTDMGGSPEEKIVEFKKLISEELTPYASSILLDPEYGIPASQLRDENAGLLLAYEKTGYDATKQGRLPDLLDDWSVYRLKNAGADAVKFLLYYDPDETESINIMKHVFMERIGAECKALDMPFFLEIVTYDANNSDVKGADYAKVKPYKVINAMKEFSKAEYFVDVLKVEVPVNMNYVEGFNSADQEVVYTTAEAKAFFKEQSESTHIPFIFLSAGVSMNLFKETLKFAKRAGSTFNGVLCGRATWKDSVSIFSQDGEDQTKEWLQSKGRDNIESLNDILKETATSWTDYYIVE